MQEGSANDGNLPRVEFHLNFLDAADDNALLVYVNGALQDFSREELQIQEFTGNRTLFSSFIQG